MPDDDRTSPPSARRYRLGERVTINGIPGKIVRPGYMIDAKNLRDNPAFDPNYESEQGRYNGPLWQPLEPDDKTD